jgi:FlaA1/EpsC-like NDP-sugar epimerase
MRSIQRWRKSECLWYTSLAMEAIYSGKTILVTGACGFIGSAIAKALLRLDPRLLILLDHSEFNIYTTQLELTAIPNPAPYDLILGDICDGPLLAEIFQKHRPDIVIHSAAFKHVPLLETNPFEAIRNNVIGTLSLAKTAVQHNTAKMLTISTDKAVNPQSILGASKRVAELVSLRWSSKRSHMNVIRLGNVLGSPGSVVPLFLHQISRGGPVTVTHPEVSRYFVILGDAVELILAAGRLKGCGEVYVPKLGEPVKIIDLARHLIREAGLEPEKDIPIVFAGLRPGDKITEEFVSTGESLIPCLDSRFSRIDSSGTIAGNCDDSIAELQASCSRRDLPALLQVLSRLVPEYWPSESLFSQMKQSAKSQT